MYHAYDLLRAPRRFALIETHVNSMSCGCDRKTNREDTVVASADLTVQELVMASAIWRTGMNLVGWQARRSVDVCKGCLPIAVRAAVERLAGTGTQTGTGGFGGNPSDGVSAEDQMVTRVGIEPTTPGLKGRYSAN